MKLKSLFLLLLLSNIAFAQLKTENYKIYNTQSKSICSLEDMIKSLVLADVVFFGEEHNDPTGHQLESDVLQKLHQLNGKKQTLSMEMFEKDIQQVMNEYLQNLIREKNFIKEARAWNNYNDYKPMIEYAREKELAVIAANPPNRYVNLVTRKGLSALNPLDRSAKKWLPPLPIDTATGAYYKNFLKTMGGHTVPGMEIYQSQNLWDSGMAHSIFQYLKKNKGDKVFHILGRFHSDEKLGTMAKLLKYNAGLKLSNISSFSDKSFNEPDWSKFSHLGDFVIITNPDLKRTF
ncbi:ChaN family lipoprotein [Daejeonella rubra]|nr:ChaN family lipoprotein [Daejeonella rubra]